MDRLPEARQQILGYIKDTAGATVSETAEHMSISYEAARQQLVALEKDGLVASSLRRREDGGAGRPASEYRLTERGEDVFPKAYDALAVEMIDTVASELGPQAMRKLLQSLTEARVQRWMPRLDGLSLQERVRALRDLYAADDPYTSVDEDGDELYLIERNCPFLNIAKQRPALCSVTVSTLQRLLGYRVERVEKFQSGDGRCVFRVCTDKPLENASPFEFEETPAL